MKYSKKLERDYPRGRKYLSLYNFIWEKLNKLLESKEQKDEHTKEATKIT